MIFDRKKLDNNTLLDIYKRETSKLDGSATDTNKRLKIKLNILEKYVAIIGKDENYNDEDYQTVIDDLKDKIKESERSL